MAKKKTKTGPLAKQRASIYTMMLIFSFVALVLACVLMYLELKEYDFDIEAKDYRAVFHVPAIVAPSETIA